MHRGARRGDAPLQVPVEYYPAAPLLLLRGARTPRILRGMTAHRRAARTQRRTESCQYCGGELVASVFDTVFRAERQRLPERLDPAALETIESLLAATAPGADDGTTDDERGDFEERLFFAIPGALCVPCRQLYVDQQLIGILGLSDARCTFAIESDRVLRAGAA